MRETLSLLDELATDVTRSPAELTPAQFADIAVLKAQAAAMSPNMAIVEPTDPNEPSPDPDREPQKNPVVN